MKYLVVSDLHGSKSAASFISEKMMSGDFNLCLCLGDILYHGPRNDLPNDYNPKEGMDILNQLKDKIVAVRGNCDSEVDQMVLDFPIMSDLNQLMVGDKKVLMTHGHLDCDKFCFDILLSGHTHIPVAQISDDVVLCNPGSLTIPKGGYEKSYGILCEHSFQVYELDGKLIMEVKW